MDLYRGAITQHLEFGADHAADLLFSLKQQVLSGSWHLVVEQPSVDMVRNINILASTSYEANCLFAQPIRTSNYIARWEYLQCESSRV
jgi:hypothetical protein